VDFAAITSAFVLLFLAELGDKTQLMTMTLAHRYPVRPVVAGVFSAFLVLNLLAIGVGAALYRYVPTELVLVAAGLLFLFFAWRSWCEADGEDEEEGEAVDGRSAFVASFTLIFVAELGDKTQLALIALAAGARRRAARRGRALRRRQLRAGLLHLRRCRRHRRLARGAGRDRGLGV
jgi:putative Ca2+/H+ antiporter (TMEM165/GDT1 family)